MRGLAHYCRFSSDTKVRWITEVWLFAFTKSEPCAPQDIECAGISQRVSER